MNTKQTFLLWLACIVIGGISAVKMTPANAHVNNANPNHGHVCTASDPLTVRTQPEVGNNKLTTVAKNSVVTIIGGYSNWTTNEVWYRINTSKGKGYVNGNYICF